MILVCSAFRAGDEPTLHEVCRFWEDLISDVEGYEFEALVLEEYLEHVCEVAVLAEQLVWRCSGL